MSGVPGPRETVDAVWRMEAAKIVATLTRTVGDIGLAEDLASEALVDALPLTGLGKPDKKAVRAKFWEGAPRAVG